MEAAALEERAAALGAQLLHRAAEAEGLRTRLWQRKTEVDDLRARLAAYEADNERAGDSMAAAAGLRTQLAERDAQLHAARAQLRQVQLRQVLRIALCV